MTITSSRRTLAAVLSVAACAAATYTVPAGSNFQSTLNIAQSGDTIVLEAGATYTGNFTLPAKSGTAPIIITTSRAAELPASGTRVSPAHAYLMPKIQAPGGGSAIRTAAGANNWTIRGIEMMPTAGVYTYDLVNLSSPTPSDAAAAPSNIIIDQCFIHGDASVGAKRGVAVNGSRLTVQNSHISNIRTSTQDTQAVAGWNGAGPITITNNYLEASGENVMFGGAAPSVTGLIPSDIRISGNYIRKPSEWRTLGYAVKNLLELKNARRVSITGNVFENNWIAAQNGFGILFTVRTCEAGDYQWAVVQNVVFENNIVRNSTNGVNILGTDTLRSGCPAPTVAGKTSDIAVRNNLFDNIGLNEQGSFAQVLSGAERITIEHNTVFQGRSFLLLDGAPIQSLVVRNNIARYGAYTVKGSNVGEGLSTLNLYAPGWTFEKNVIIGLPANMVSSYPVNNYFPATVADVAFVNTTAGDYNLSLTSLYKGLATDGTNPGANIDSVRSATVNSVSGASSQPATVTPTWTVSANYTGTSVNLQWAVTPASSTADRICLDPATGGSSVWCAYATGATSGIATVPGTVPAGTYVAKYILAVGTVAATSSAVTVPAPAVTPAPTPDSSPAPAPVVSGPTVTVSAAPGKATIQWTAPAGSSSTDYITVATAVGNVWTYRTGGAASGSATASLPAGQYKARYYGSSATPTAESAVFVVAAAPPSVTAVYSITPVIELTGRLWVQWAAPAGRPVGDSITLYGIGSGTVRRYSTAGTQTGRVAVDSLPNGRYMITYTTSSGSMTAFSLIDYAPFVRP